MKKLYYYPYIGGPPFRVHLQKVGPYYYYSHPIPVPKGTAGVSGLGEKLIKELIVRY